MNRLRVFGILFLIIGVILFNLGYHVLRSAMMEEIPIESISIPPKSSKDIPISYKEGRYEFTFTSTWPVNFLSSDSGILLDSENNVTFHESFVQGSGDFTLSFQNNANVESEVTIKMYYIPDIVLLPCFLGIVLIIVGVVVFKKGSSKSFQT